MFRLTSVLLIVAASGAMIAGCASNSAARGNAKCNPPGQGACLASGNGPGQGACQFNCSGPNQRGFAANGNGRSGAQRAGRGLGPGSVSATGRGGNGRGACCGGDGGCAVPTGAATQANEATAMALRATLEDELTAQALYAAILSKHGEVRPFTNIIRAEERHAQLLRTLMERHHVDASGVTARALPEIPATVPECAELGAKIERDNVAMYDRFVGVATDADIKAAFERLRAASLNNHLPAFERIAASRG